MKNNFRKLSNFIIVVFDQKLQEKSYVPLDIPDIDTADMKHLHYEVSGISDMNSSMHHLKILLKL